MVPQHHHFRSAALQTLHQGEDWMPPASNEKYAGMGTKGKSDQTHCCGTSRIFHLTLCLQVAYNVIGLTQTHSC